MIIDIGKPFDTPLHFIISDAFGNHLIVEFIDGEMKTYTSEAGVLTNDPPFDWTICGVIRDHTNLSYYLFSDFNSKYAGLRWLD